ncbi:TonB-dependent receptor [Myxococcota bacterium]|nr:TonB-dependent receptor [Myxococcota bacterium]
MGRSHIRHAAARSLRTRGFSHGILAGCLALLPVPGLGETPDSPEVVEVPPIDVQGVPPTATDSAASAVRDPVDRPEDLEASEGPGTAVGRLPSVRLRETGGPGQPRTIMVRGTDPSATMASLDGVPLNSPFLGGADLGGLDLVPLEGIEVVRGGRGQEAIGGRLEARTPDPLGGPRFQGTLGGGSFGTFWLKGFTVQPLGRRTGVLAGAGGRRTEGRFPFRDSNGVLRQRDHAAASSLEALVRVDGITGSGWRLGALVEGAFTDRQEPGLEQFPSATATQRDSRLILSATASGPLPGSLPGTLEGALFYRRLAFVYQDPKPPMGPPTASTLVAHGIGGRLRAEIGPWPVASLFASLEGTGDLGRVYRVTRAPQRPARGTVAGALGARIGRPADPFEVFGEARVLWAQGAGVRVAPRLGAWWSPWKPLRLFLNGSRAFRLPTLEELHFDVGFVQGNPDLRPEEAWTWDAGIEAADPGTWRLRASYFENHLDNLILFLPRSAFLVKADNSGRATMRGVEALGEFQWRFLSIRASYTFLWSAFGASGLSLPDRPAHVVQGEVGLAFGPFRLALLPGWQSSFYLDRFESTSEEARFRLDARLEWRFQDAVRVSLEARNLTDQRDAVDSLQRPLPGFSLFTQVIVSP